MVNQEISALNAFIFSVYVKRYNVKATSQQQFFKKIIKVYLFKPDKATGGAFLALHALFVLGAKLKDQLNRTVILRTTKRVVVGSISLDKVLQ